LWQVKLNLLNALQTGYYMHNNYLGPLLPNCVIISSKGVTRKKGTRAASLTHTAEGLRLILVGWQARNGKVGG
jgi:hypothetical protein